VLSEAVVLVDTLGTVVVGLILVGLSEVVTLADNTWRAANKIIGETISVTDTVRTALGKRLSEIVGIADTFNRSTQRRISEVLTLTDSVGARITARVLTETVRLRGTLYLIFNGIYVGLWGKMERAIGSWTKVEKPDE
jgi:phage-related protein